MTQSLDSIDGIIETLYAVISGEAGEPRDWALERTLYHPRALLTRSGVDATGKPWAKAMTLEEYIVNVEPYLAGESFYEHEIARRVQRFGNIAHVYSTYEAKSHPDDPAPFKRGINSIQLYHDGDRWWILSIAWDNEREGNTLGDEHL